MIKFRWYFFSLLCCVASPAYGISSWYVDNQATGSVRDGSKEHPFLQLQNALNSAYAGDTIYVVASKVGYTGVCVYKNNLRFIGTGGQPVLNQLVTCDGRNALFFSRANDVSIENFKLDAAAFAGQSARALIFSGLPTEPIYRNHANKIKAYGPGQGHSGRSLVSSSFCYNCVLENSFSSGAEEHGIYWTNHQDGSIIRNNTVTDTDGACLQLNSDPETYNPSNPYQDGIMSNNLIEGNVFYNCGDSSGGAAINLAGVEDSVFRNNLVYGSPMTGGIANWDDSFGDRFGCKRNAFYNNLIDCRHCDRHALSFRNGSIGNSFVNNIVITGTKDAIAVDSESNQHLTIDYNLFLSNVFFEDTSERWISLERWRQEMGYDTHSVAVNGLDAVFVNHGSADYHLTEDSAARDTGAFVPVTVDFDGNSRPLGRAYDIGPFEYNPGPPTTDPESQNMNPSTIFLLLETH